MSKVNYLKSPIRSLKVRFVKIIASFNSKTNDNQPHPINNLP